MTDKLKPCPFCNALTAMLEQVPDEPDLWRVRCQACSLQTRRSVAPDAVVEAWNTRASTPALSGEVVRLCDAARNALLLIESGEFADTASIDEEEVANELRAAIAATSEARSMSGGSR